MQARQRPWPRVWLMTDERLGDGLWDAIGRLPAGKAGLVFRHYSLGRTARSELGLKVAAIARGRNVMLVVGRDVELALRLGADVVHNPTDAAGNLAISRSIHDFEEAAAAKAEGSDLAFISPVFATRSHPEGRSLGPQLAARLARRVAVPAIALGGMTAERFASLEAAGFYGWAAIDAWLPAKSFDAR